MEEKQRCVGVGEGGVIGHGTGAGHSRIELSQIEIVAVEVNEEVELEIATITIFSQGLAEGKGVLSSLVANLLGERTREKFEEMRYLEKSIGKTGCLAMSPFLKMTRKDLWQLYVLE